MKVAFQDFTIDFALERRGAVPMFRQLYLSLRDAIIGGRLPPGARLPPTRELARRLAVGRNTVINAYEQLTAEGYVEGRIGSGTRVGAEMPVDAKPVTAVVRAAVAPTRADAPQRTARPSLFRIDEPAFDSFPFETMRRLVTNRMRDDFAGVLRNDDPQGYEPLRRAITRYVTAERGIACSASQVVITAGSLHGLDLVARALSMTGETACVENPGDIAARANLSAAGVKLLPVPVDGHGCCVEWIVSKDPEARLVVITPSNQYPLGGTMTLARRLSLLEWSARSGALIFEDDADSEFRYATRPLAPLKALDRRESVIYAATFSRILHPNLRLGYLILPPRMVADVVAVRRTSDRHPPPLEQVMVAEFIARGHFAIHVRRMRKLYRDRQAEFVSLMRRHLPPSADVRPAGAGINILVTLPAGVDDVAIAENAAREGFDIHALSPFYATRRPLRGILVGSASRGTSLGRDVGRLAALVGRAGGLGG